MTSQEGVFPRDDSTKKEPAKIVAPATAESKTHPKPTWDPDESATCCTECGAVFSFTKRRHHCRGCGKIFCDECTQQRFEFPPEYGYKGEQRVCESCYLLLYARKALNFKKGPVNRSSTSVPEKVPVKEPKQTAERIPEKPVKPAVESAEPAPENMTPVKEPEPSDCEEFNPDELIKGYAIAREEFCVVFKGMYHRKEVAIKEIINQESMTGEELADFKRELTVTKELRHDAIVKFIGSSDADKLFVVLEYCRYGSLKDALVNFSDNFDEKLKMKCLLNTASAMEFIHKHNFIHRDLKSDNVLMVSLDPDSDIVAKVSVFGTTRKMDTNKTVTRGVGTPAFMAPELLKGSNKYDKSVDVYSFALVMYFMFTGRLPFADDPQVTSPFIYAKAIIEGKRPTVPLSCPKVVKELMKVGWDSDPTKRPSFERIHSVLESYFKKPEGEKKQKPNPPQPAKQEASPVKSAKQNEEEEHAIRGEPKKAEGEAAKAEQIISKTAKPVDEAPATPIAISSTSTTTTTTTTTTSNKASSVEEDRGELVQAVVMDNGSGVFKAGLSGASSPGIVFPTVVSHHPPPNLHNGSCFVGSDRFFNVQYPIKRGIVTNWDDMEEIYRYAFGFISRENSVDAKNLPVLLTDGSMNRENRETMAELMFEKFSVPALHIAIPAVLSLFHSGRCNGIAVDIGEGLCQIVPVVEGYALHHAISLINMSGSDLNEHLWNLLRPERSFFGTSMTKSVLKVVCEIKEKLCYVASSYNDELDKAVSEIEKSFELPDGEVITVGKERFLCPEALFQPELFGFAVPSIQRATLNSINKCKDCDFDTELNLYSNIVLSGGSTMFTGVAKRMQKELSSIAPLNRAANVKVTTLPEPNNAAWIGGSAFASHSCFPEMCLFKEEYEEYGRAAIHRKCF